MTTHKKHFSTIFLGLIIGTLIGTSIFFYIQYQSALKDLSKGTSKVDAAAVKKEVQGYTEKISKFLVLPKEEALLFTVSDKTKLNKQAFFKDAQNGDKLLVYSKASLAFLYRPTTNIIVSVGPLLTPAQNTSTSTVEPTKTPLPTPQAMIDKTNQVKKKITIYNGSKVAGLSSQIETNLLNANVENIEVVAKEMALKNDYVRTQISDVSGDNNALIQKLATLLGADVMPIPTDEAKPKSDILIIAGK